MLKTSKPCVPNVVAIERFDCNYMPFIIHLQAEVSVGEVMSCPNRLGTSNADGPDGIPPQLIQECSTESPQVCA